MVSPSYERGAGIRGIEGHLFCPLEEEIREGKQFLPISKMGDRKRGLVDFFLGGQGEGV